MLGGGSISTQQFSVLRTRGQRAEEKTNLSRRHLCRSGDVARFPSTIFSKFALSGDSGRWRSVFRAMPIHEILFRQNRTRTNVSMNIMIFDYSHFVYMLGIVYLRLNMCIEYIRSAAVLRPMHDAIVLFPILYFFGPGDTVGTSTTSRHVLPGAKTLAWLCVLVTFGILVCTLWPFDAFPPNRVSWLEQSNGICFRQRGVVLSQSQPAQSASDAMPCSLELWIQPAQTSSVSTILNIYDPANPHRLLIRNTSSGSSSAMTLCHLSENRHA